MHVMGVCCIVFDIDGMLFEFFMNFLNIEKSKILRTCSREISGDRVALFIMNRLCWLYKMVNCMS